MSAPTPVRFHTGDSKEYVQAQAARPMTDAIQRTARAIELRGRCSGCDTILKVRLQGPARVRCPVCHRVGMVRP